MSHFVKIEGCYINADRVCHVGPRYIGSNEATTGCTLWMGDGSEEGALVLFHTSPDEFVRLIRSPEGYVTIPRSDYETLVAAAKAVGRG